MIFLDISRYPCPHCNQTINVHDFQDLSTRICKRDPFECPHCHKQVIWNKKPFLISNIALWLAFLTFPLPFTGLYSFSVGLWMLFSLLLTFAIALPFKKLEVI